MKKGLFLVIITLFIFTGCTVNETTGLLVITNLSDKAVTDIKVGDIFINIYLDKGMKYDYYYCGNLKGKMSGGGVDLVSVQYGYTADAEHTGSYFKDNVDCFFVPNYEYHIDIMKFNGRYRMMVNKGFKPGSGEPSYDYPAN